MDRLSDLPDGLIHHILSFLDTKLAVQMCLLSKRWFHLWTCLTVLNFDSEPFTAKYKFNKFVRRVLSGRRRSHPCDLRRLKFHSNSTNKSVLDRVIHYAVSHSVQEINIMHTHCLTHELLSCVTLRSLHLEQCELSDDLFSRCMNLETLSLNECYIFEEEKINISAPRLVKLSIRMLNDDFYLPIEQRVVISSPKLSSFWYEGKCPQVLAGDKGPFLTLGWSLDRCPVLERMDIRISGSYKETMEALRCCLWLRTLLEKMIFHAKSIVVRKNGLMVKTILCNDGVCAIVYNEDTAERGEDLWCCGSGTKRGIVDFVLPIVGWFDDQLWIEEWGIGYQPAPIEFVAAFGEAELCKLELKLQKMVLLLQSNAIQVPEEPSTIASEAKHTRVWLLKQRLMSTIERCGIYVPNVP